MNKAKEKKIFDYIYGGRFGNTVRSYEIPDFIISHDNITLGVEVTEAYEDDTDARLKHHKGYMADLLDGVRDVLDADKGQVSVDEITLLGKNGDETKVTAIIRGVPPFHAALNKILYALSEKEKKCGSYLEHCDQVDLIIHDSSKMFFFDNFKDFHYSLFYSFDGKLIIDSKFREIYLVTSLEKEGVFYLPLRASLFFGDLTALVSFISENEELDKAEDKYKVQIILASLYQLGHRNVFVNFQDFEFSIFHRAWMIIYKEDKTIVRDYSNILTSPDGFVNVEEYISNLTEEQDEIIKKLIDQRKGVAPYFPMVFSVSSLEGNVS